jgi:hypothetical protein
MDPVIEEMQRAREVRPDVLRRWARYFRIEIQPKLDRLETLELELAAEKEEAPVAAPERRRKAS